MKKIGLLALALVLALGSLGVGFALWSETLYLDGYVYTGELSADWSLEAYGDDEAADKDVSWVDAYIVDGWLYVYVYNAYPCINYYVDFDVTNTGTIPLHVCNLYCDYYGFPGTVTITNLGSNQVHSGDSVYGTIEIHLDNTAEENGYYYFYCDQTVVQYNEPCPY